jgi:hypothetical protein
VIASLFWIPLIVPVNAGFAAPIVRAKSSAATISRPVPHVCHLLADVG